MQERILTHFAIFFFFQLLLSSCATVQYSEIPFNQPLSECKQHRENLKTANSSPLYLYIPRHRCQIKWYDIPHWTSWAIAGNDDDGIFGEAQNNPYKLYMCNTPQKALCWWFRNPFHNLFHYVIGSAHRVNSEWTLFNINSCGIQLINYKPIANKNFGSSGSSFFLALHGGKPYISFRLVYFNKYRTDFYLGWRKNGAFGLKLHPFHTNNKKKAPYEKKKRRCICHRWTYPIKGA